MQRLIKGLSARRRAPGDTARTNRRTSAKVLSRLRSAVGRRASFSNVVSLVALFIALGGASYAAGLNIPNHSIGEQQLKAQAVGRKELKDGAANQKKIGKDAIGSAQLQQQSVDESKVKQGSLGQAALAAGAIGQQQLQADAVNHQALAPGAVGVANLADSAVTQGKLAAGAVGQQALAIGAVGQGNLADSAVTQGKLAAGAVGAAEVKDGTLAPQKFTANGLPEVGYSSREMSAIGYETVPKFASNNGVLNLDITPAPATNGYTSSSGVVGAVAPSRLTAIAQVVLKANVDTNLQCRLSLYHAGQGDQQPFAAGTNTFATSGNEYALPLAGGIDVEPGSYNVRVQCFTYPNADGSASFARGSLTVTIAPR